ncbi:TIGR04255 family protein [Rheinheimera faecalis]
MLLTNKPRVKFHKNPLIEVVAQFRFAIADESIHKPEVLIGIHDKVRSDLPLFNKVKSLGIHVNTEAQTVEQLEQFVYEFSTIDGEVKLSFDGQVLTCVTNRYSSKEVFFRYIFLFYEALETSLKLSPITRVGLRYKDVIQRSTLGAEIIDSNWEDLLNDSLVSMLTNNEFRGTISGFQNQFIVDITKDEKLQASCFLGRHSLSKELCFIVDSDFFTEGVMDYGSAKDFLNKSNIYARNFFQWCIKPKLYDSLEPEPIPE